MRFLRDAAITIGVVILICIGLVATPVLITIGIGCAVIGAIVLIYIIVRAIRLEMEAENVRQRSNDTR